MWLMTIRQWSLGVGLRKWTEEIGNKVFQETKHCIGRTIYAVIEIINFNMCGERKERDNEPSVAMSKNEGKSSGQLQ